MQSPDTDTLRNALTTIEQDSTRKQCATHTDEYETVHVFVADKTSTLQQLYTVQQFAAPDVLGLPEDMSAPLTWPELLAALAYFEIDVLNGWMLTTPPSKERRARDGDGEWTSNEERHATGLKTLSAFAKLAGVEEGEVEDNLIDLIADLFHVAWNADIPLGRILGIAAYHFQDELGDHALSRVEIRRTALQIFTDAKAHLASRPI